MDKRMDISTLENWLWDAACSIRGPIDAPKFKDYILPLLFYKRLCDVYEDEIRKLSKEFENEQFAKEIIKSDRKLIRFYIPDEYTWREIRKITTNLGEKLTEALKGIAKENPKFQGVIDIVDFNATAAGQRIISDDTLARLMEILNGHRLGLKEKGKLVVVIDTGVVSRGSGNAGSNREKEIRKKVVDNDYVEAVILIPENLFYNAGGAGNIIVINKSKPHKGEILLINASKEFAKGRPKNYLTDENIKRIEDVYTNWEEVEGFSKIITNEDAARNDYDLSPSRYVATGEKEEILPVEEILVELEQVEEEREVIDKELDGVLQRLGFGGWQGGT